MAHRGSHIRRAAGCGGFPDSGRLGRMSPESTGRVAGGYFADGSSVQPEQPVAPAGGRAACVRLSRIGRRGQTPCAVGMAGGGSMLCACLLHGIHGGRSGVRADAVGALGCAGFGGPGEAMARGCAGVHVGGRSDRSFGDSLELPQDRRHVRGRWVQYRRCVGQGCGTGAESSGRADGAAVELGRDDSGDAAVGVARLAVPGKL